MPENERTQSNGKPLPQPEVVGLVRVSTAEQARDDRAGIARQRQVIEETIRRKNLRCRKVYELHDVSGTEVLRNRQIQEILEIVKTGVGLVVADLDRLFRPSEPADFAILQFFKDARATIYSGDSEFDLNNKDSALFANIRSAISGYELQLIKERAHGAKEAKRRAGKCPTNYLTLPHGLSYERSTETWWWNAKRWELMEIFRAFLKETSNYSELGRRFGLSGRTIRNILSNPIYATGQRLIDTKRGEKRVSRNGKVYRVKVKRPPDEIIKFKVIDPIISLEDFNRVQRRIADTQFNHQERRKHDQTVNYGSGVLRCGHCAETMYCSSGKRRAGKRTGQYFCKRNYYLYRDRLGGCQQPNLRQPEVDLLIESFAIRTLTNAETLTHIIESSLRRTTEVVRPFPQQVESQLASLKQKEKRLLDAYEGGAVTLDELRTRREAVKSKIASLKRQTANVQEQPETSIEEFARKVVRGAFRFKRLSDRNEKKAIILSLFSDLYLKDSSIIAFKFRDDFGMKSGVKLGAGFSAPPIHLKEPFALPPAESPLPEGMKRCSACRRVLSVTDFYPRKNQCRSCIAVRAHGGYVRRRARALEEDYD